MPKPNAGYIRRTDRQRQALRPIRIIPAELSAPTIPGRRIRELCRRDEPDTALHRRYLEPLGGMLS